MAFCRRANRGHGPLPLKLRIAAVLALGAVLGATPAHADQAADTLKRLNLLGRWANDCADATRTRVSYEINAFRMISANTYVPTMNRNERNEYTVRNGILLSTGRKMPPLRRCDGQGTS